MKIIETCPREKGSFLWGHCQNLLDDPRTYQVSLKSANWFRRRFWKGFYHVWAWGNLGHSLRAGQLDLNFSIGLVENFH